MLSQSHFHIILGLRPSGKIERVDKSSGLTDFVDPSEATSGMLLEFSVFADRDTRFASRPRSFLTLLRQSRVDSLLTSRKTSKKGKSPDSSSGKSPSKRRRSSTASAVDSVTSQLSLLDPASANRIRLALAGLSAPARPDRR